MESEILKVLNNLNVCNNFVCSVIGYLRNLSLAFAFHMWPK